MLISTTCSLLGHATFFYVKYWNFFKALLWTEIVFLQPSLSYFVVIASSKSRLKRLYKFFFKLFTSVFTLTITST